MTDYVGFYQARLTSSTFVSRVPSAREIQTMAQKAEPLTCPFCGDTPRIIPWHGGGKRKRLIECDNDECSIGPSITGPTRADAVAKWNIRA